MIESDQIFRGYERSWMSVAAVLWTGCKHIMKCSWESGGQITHNPESYFCVFWRHLVMKRTHHIFLFRSLCCHQPFLFLFIPSGKGHEKPHALFCVSRWKVRCNLSPLEWNFNTLRADTCRALSWNLSGMLVNYSFNKCNRIMMLSKRPSTGQSLACVLSIP